VVIITTGLRGVLEAHQQFSLIVKVSIPLGIFTFLGPLLALSVSNDLFTMVAVLLVGRLVAGLAYLNLCFRTAPALRHNMILQRAMVRPLLRFGSWMTVTNIIGPFMDYLDRLLIGALLSVAAVAYYATPYDVVTRLWLIPVALTGVLFPAFASTLEADRDRAARLFWRGVKYVFLALFPITLVIVTFAHEGLELWLGPEFAANSLRVLQWLAVGVFINSLARVPYALVQAAGRPDLTAKLHLFELPFYLLAVWWLITRFGIEGAAIAWVARVALDAILLFTVARRFLPRCATAKWQMPFATIMCLLVLTCAFVPVGVVAKGTFVLVMAPVFTFAAWRLVLTPDELALIRDCLKNVGLSH
jgi:O-antigen/teichoic acid export membrane protein